MSEYLTPMQRRWLMSADDQGVIEISGLNGHVRLTADALIKRDLIREIAPRQDCAARIPRYRLTVRGEELAREVSGSDA